MTKIYNLKDHTKTFWYHLPAIAAFLCLAVLTVIYTKSKGEMISGDMGIYITIANALVYPDLFSNSIAFSNIDQYGLWGYTLTPTVIKSSIKVFGSYMPGIYALSFFNIFFLLIGFYNFCHLYCQTRWSSFLNTFLLLVPINLGVWATYWGLNTLVQPRQTFLCFFIWLLLFAAKSWDKPQYWPVLMIFQGCLVLVHPISTFATALGLWCSFIPFIPPRWRWGKKIAWMFFCGSCFLVSASPSFLHKFSAGNTIIPYSTWLEIWASRTIWMSFYEGLGRFLIIYCIKLPIIPAALILGFCSWKKSRGNDRKMLKFIWSFTIGILFTILLYFAYHHIYAWIEKIPPQTQLIRSMKFLIFIALLIISFSLSRLLGDTQKNRYYIILVSVIVLIGLGGNLFDFTKQLFGGVRSQFNKSDVIDEQTHNYRELIQFASKTPPNSRFLGNVDLIPLRNNALRPLAYSFKDGAILLLFNHPAILSWYQATLMLPSFLPTKEPVPDPSKFLSEVIDRPISKIQKIAAFLSGLVESIKQHGMADTFKNRKKIFQDIKHRHLYLNGRKNKILSPSLHTWCSEALRLKANYLVLEKDQRTDYKKINPDQIAWQNRQYVVISIDSTFGIF